ncbi:MAG TPA: hypothetical protein VFM31_08385 [Nitrososphaeraceae archaeon]|nr:hypothetical protein [Nitrososphaeraceae archaeon]
MILIYYPNLRWRNPQFEFYFDIASAFIINLPFTVHLADPNSFPPGPAAFGISTTKLSNSYVTTASFPVNRSKSALIGCIHCVDLELLFSRFP